MASRAEDRLFELAVDSAGYFTMREAASAGLAPTTVLKLLKRGRLERLSRGVYRIANYPLPRIPDLWAALLWPRGVAETPSWLSHETALLLHNVSDVNPAEIHVTVNKGVRLRRPPPPLVLHRAAVDDVDEVELEEIDGLPVTTLEQTLRDLVAAGTSIATVEEIERKRRAERASREQ